MPTQGFNIKSLMHDGFKLNVWDIGGMLPSIAELCDCIVARWYRTMYCDVTVCEWRWEMQKNVLKSVEDSIMRYDRDGDFNHILTFLNSNKPA